MRNNKNSYYKKSYVRLRRLASMLNLSISKWFAFGNKLIGLDQKNKRLLISEGYDNQSPSQLIELEKIKNISLKKSYGSIRAGEIGQRTIGEFLKYIGLQFEHSNNQETTVLSLYEEEKGERKGLIRFDLSSKNLHLLLSKIVRERKSPEIQSSQK